MRPVMMSRMISKSFDVSASGSGFFALDDGFESDNMSLKKPLESFAQRPPNGETVNTGLPIGFQEIIMNLVHHMITGFQDNRG